MKNNLKKLLAATAVIVMVAGCGRQEFLNDFEDGYKVYFDQLVYTDIRGAEIQASGASTIDLFSCQGVGVGEGVFSRVVVEGLVNVVVETLPSQSFPSGVQLWITDYTLSYTPLPSPRDNLPTLVALDDVIVSFPASRRSGQVFNLSESGTLEQEFRVEVFSEKKQLELADNFIAAYGSGTSQFDNETGIWAYPDYLLTYTFFFQDSYGNRGSHQVEYKLTVGEYADDDETCDGDQYRDAAGSVDTVFGN